MSIISHGLKIDPLIRLFAQKRRSLGEMKRPMARQEVEKFLEAGFVRKVHFKTCVANPYLVKINECA